MPSGKKGTSVALWGIKVTFVSILLVLTLISYVFSKEDYRTIHVFVALCDNLNQGIVPVPHSLGNGEDPGRNLYWGALYGVKAFFKKSSNWNLISDSTGPKEYVLERCIFEHRGGRVFLVADAYRGSCIKQAIIDFLESASGRPELKVSVRKDGREIDPNRDGIADMAVYVGHDGLMDFQLENYPEKNSCASIDAIILACMSREFFREAIKKSGARPLLWTNGLMSPEAYTLESALEGWIKKEDNEKIRIRAAKAYSSYQKCGLNASKRLFSSGQ